MNHGLTNRDLETIYGIFEKYPEIKKVFLFGSRAMGSFHKGSDIDLAVLNPGIPDETLLNIKTDFEESSLPYFVDIINYHQIKDDALKSHIDRTGKPFYKRKHRKTDSC